MLFRNVAVYRAPTGLVAFSGDSIPRALPWAMLFRPFGAWGRWAWTGDGYG